MHRLDDGVPLGALPEGPAQGRARGLGAVDADDDPLGLTVGASGGHAGRGGADDGDRPGGVVQALLADRAEQEPLEAAEAPGAHHEEVGLLGGLEQPGGGHVADGAPRDTLRGLGAQRLLEGGEERGVGLGGVVLGVEATAAVGVPLVEQVPDEHGHQLGAVQLGLAGRPAQRHGAVLGPVHTDNDLLHDHSLACRGDAR